MLRCGGASLEELLTLRGPVPRGLLSVIDDLVLLEKAADVKPSPLSSARLRKIEEAYLASKLPTNQKKAFDDSLTGSFWGVQVDGRKGLVRANETRSWPLVLITVRVCCLGLCTIGLLRSLVGSYISILSLRRRTMSAMNLVFEAISASTDDCVWGGPLTDELFTLVALSLLSVVNLRSTALSTIRADASDWGMAAVSADLPVQVAREAMCLSLSKSVWSNLLPPLKAWKRVKELLLPEDELPGAEVFDVHPFWEDLACCVSYKEQWRKPHLRALRGYLIEEKRLCKQHCSFRVPVGLDSQVALGALVKGRSSSRALNAELCRSLGYYLGSDVYPGFGYFPSALNRADGPTRFDRPAPVSRPLPWWWEPVVNENYDAFDR